MNNKPKFKDQLDKVRLNFPKLTATDQYKIANYIQQAWEAGYRYAVVNDWSIAFDKSLAAQEEQYAKQDASFVNKRSCFCTCDICFPD